MATPAESAAGGEPSVTAVILTYRRDELLRRAVEAVLAQDRPPDRVLVVDNADMAGAALAGIEGVDIVTTGSNLGPAGGYAFAFERALADGAAKVWVVDDDVVPEAACLGRLLAASDGVDVVFPLQRKPGRDRGFPPSWNGPLIDAEAIRRAGPPRADLFFFAEDTEFFHRLARHGVPIRRQPDAVVMHLNPEDRVRGTRRDWRLYYEVRNGLWIRLRDRDRSLRQLWRALRMVAGKLVSIVLLEPGKAASLRLWWMGVQDFRRGRLGVVVDPAEWRVANAGALRSPRPRIQHGRRFFAGIGRKMSAVLNSSRGGRGRGRRAARAVVRVAPVRGVLRFLSLRGALPRALWRRLPVDWPFRVPVTAGPPGSSFVYEPGTRDLFARPLHWRGLKGKEAETLTVFVGLVGDAPADSVVVDVGAHTGLYTLVACAVSPAVRVIAFEAEPRVFARLERNVKANGWGARCELRQQAVSDATGTVAFHSPHHPLPTSGRLALAPARDGDTDLIEVDATTIDDALGEDQPVSVVKIDVEGVEDRVLRGMKRVLADDRPAVVVECLPGGPLDEINALLAGAGYRLFHLRPNGPVEVARIVADPARRHRNYLGLHEDDERRARWVATAPARS